MLPVALSSNEIHTKAAGLPLVVPVKPFRYGLVTRATEGKKHSSGSAKGIGFRILLCSHHITAQLR